MKRAIGYAILILFFLLAPFGALFAIEAPLFPTCSNPQGTLKVAYPTGTHGIAGDDRTFQGSDAVYFVTPDLLFQCFCPVTTGEGIQTNWINASQLSESEIQTYQAEGWVLIPHGEDWGLDQAPYLAKNSSYSCIGGKGGNGGGGGGDGRSDGRSSCPECTATPQSPGGLGSVLGLASTGNLQSIALLLVIGVVSLAASRLMRKQSVKPSKATKPAKKTSKKKKKTFKKK